MIELMAQTAFAAVLPAPLTLPPTIRLPYQAYVDNVKAAVQQVELEGEQIELMARSFGHPSPTEHQEHISQQQWQASLPAAATSTPGNT